MGFWGLGVGVILPLVSFFLFSLVRFNLSGSLLVACLLLIRLTHINV